MVKNKNILIIGGNKGIGFFISKYLINKCKYNTVITSSTKINKKKSFYEKYKQFKIDLTKLNNLNNFYNFLRKNNISNFNTVIICAGTIGRISKFENLIVKDYNKTFQINLFGQIELSKFLIKKKLLRSNSNLIFLSTSLNIPDPYFLEYTTSKHAQYAFMLTLSEELKKKKIFVNCIMPGQFHTKMNKKKILLTKKISKKIFKQALKIKSMNEKSKIKNIEKTLDVLIKNNSKLKVSGKIISSQYDNLNKLKLKNKDLFTYIRKN